MTTPADLFILFWLILGLCHWAWPARTAAKAWGLVMRLKTLIR